jgi:hypothetical protein
MANRGNALRVTRQLALLLVAIMIVAGTLMGRARVTSWEDTLWVGVYPLAYDESPAVADFLDRLDVRAFDEITAFLDREADRYGVALRRPFRIDVGEQISSLPPEPPKQANPLSVIAWSLRLRWWAWRAVAGQPGPTPDIRLFVIFHDAETEGPLPQSLGLKEGRIGVAHVFAAQRMQGSNNVVIAHELLHTLGATDKYDPATNLPAFPDGFAEPLRQPRLPQRYAELMGGRIPLSETDAEIPQSLDQVRVGQVTAAELRWPEALPDS